MNLCLDTSRALKPQALGARIELATPRNREQIKVSVTLGLTLGYRIAPNR